MTTTPPPPPPPPSVRSECGFLLKERGTAGSIILSLGYSRRLTAHALFHIIAPLHKDTLLQNGAAPTSFKTLFICIPDRLLLRFRCHSHVVMVTKF